MQPVQVKDVVFFLKQYGVLKDWSPSQITKAVTEAIKNNTLAYTLDDETNKLTSICIAKWHDNCSDLHIIAIAGVKGSLRILVKHLKSAYPEVKMLTAFREGKPTTYNVSRLW